MRVLSAVVLWPALAIALLYLPPLGFGILAVVAVVIAYIEYLKLFVFAQNMTDRVPSLLAGILGTSCFLGGSLELAVLMLLVGSLALLAASLFGDNARANPNAALLAIAGLYYVVLPLGLIVLIRYLPNGIALVGFLFLTTWSRDVGAYAVGRYVFPRSKHFIKQAISPRKTYEGAIGGFVFSVLAAILAREWLGSDAPLTVILGLGITTGIVGQIADLVESSIKRQGGMRDSGNLIQGQGGLLDTLDSFIYTAPLLYLYLSLGV